MIIILGMHCSGTSMMSGIMKNSDFETGRNIFFRGKKRPLHEDIKLVRLNDSILRRNNGNWKNVPDWEKIKKFENKSIHMRANSYLVSLAKNKRRVSIKDPRMGVTSQWWFRRFPKKFRPKVIWITRDIEGVVGSLSMREKWAKKNPKKVESLYNKYIESIERTLDEFKPEVIKVKYEDILDEPWKNYLEICKFIGVKNPNRWKKNVLKWINPKLKRN